MLPSDETGDDALLGLLTQIERLRANEERLEAEVLQLRETVIELEAAQARRADAFDLAPIACVTLDRHGAVRNANRRALGLFGFGKQQLLGTPLLMLLAPGSRRRFLEHVVATRRTPDATTFEVTVTSRGRGAVPTRLSIRWTADGDGHYAVALVDLCERNAAFERGAHAERARYLSGTMPNHVSRKPNRAAPNTPRARALLPRTARRRVRNRGHRRSSH